jgi:hypothetical protein
MPGARHFSELVIWMLADEVRVAEGFGCDTHGEFARFLGFSRRSLNELQDALRGAALKRHITSADWAPIRMLLRRLYPAMGRFIAYLNRTPDYRKRPSHADPRTRNQNRTDLRRKDRTDWRSGDRTDPRSRDRTD